MGARRARRPALRPLSFPRGQQPRHRASAAHPAGRECRRAAFDIPSASNSISTANVFHRHSVATGERRGRCATAQRLDRRVEPPPRLAQCRLLLARREARLLASRGAPPPPLPQGHRQDPSAASYNHRRAQSPGVCQRRLPMRQLRSGQHQAQKPLRVLVGTRP
jgi:hypothetical protein